MAEEITRYTVAVGFDAALKKFSSFEKKMNKFSNKQEKALKRQISLQKQLRKLATGGVGGGAFLGGRVPSQGARAASRKERDRFLLKEEKIEQNRVKTLNQSLSTLKNSALWLDRGATEKERELKATLKVRVATAKTAAEVKKLVAATRSDLRANKLREKSLRKQNFLLAKMQSSSSQLAGNLVSAFAVAALGVGVVRVGQDFESVNNTMLAVSTNAREAGENFKFVRNEAFRLGLGLKNSAKGFAKLLAARGTLSLQDTKKLFSGVAEMSTLLGLTAEESSRATNAIQQIPNGGLSCIEIYV